MFPILYHAHHSLHPQDIPFWLGLSQKYPAPQLELGCGTGRVLIPLAEAGKTIVGLDNDPDMLHVLNKNLAGSPHARPSIVQADFTAFRFAVDFNLILLTCNTYSTIEPDTRAAFMRLVRDHLSSNGIFATSMPNPLLLKQLPPYADPEVEEVFPHPADGEPVQVSSGWERDRDSVVIHWHYDHLFSDGRVERLSAHVKHYLTTLDQHRQEFKAAGFSALTCLGDYDNSPFSPRSPHLILLAHR